MAKIRSAVTHDDGIRRLSVTPDSVDLRLEDAAAIIVLWYHHIHKICAPELLDRLTATQLTKALKEALAAHGYWGCWDPTKTPNYAPSLAAVITNLRRKGLW